MPRDYLTDSEIEFMARNRRMPGYIGKAEGIMLADVERAENDLEDYVLRQRRKLANVRALVERSDAVAEQLGRIEPGRSCEVDDIFRKAVER